MSSQGGYYPEGPVPVSAYAYVSVVWTQGEISRTLTACRKAILCHTTGLDTIDLDECRQRGIKVFNSPGTGTQTICEHAILLVGGTFRGV